MITVKDNDPFGRSESSHLPNLPEGMNEDENESLHKLNMSQLVCKHKQIRNESE